MGASKGKKGFNFTVLLPKPHIQYSKTIIHSFYNLITILYSNQKILPNPAIWN